MRYLWNIAVLHILGAAALGFMTFGVVFVSGGQVNRDIVAILWGIVSLASFLFGAGTASDGYTILGDEFKKLKRIRITTEGK